MKITEFLAHLRELDVRLWVENNQLRFSAPKGRVTPEIRAQLVQRKEEIISFLQEATAVTISAQPIPPAPKGESVPLSFAQQRLWLLDQLEPDNNTYNISILLRLTGNLDHQALNQAINEVIKRHDILRTTFHKEEGKPPVQIVAPAQTLTLATIQLQHLPSEAQAAEVQKIAQFEAEKTFDLRTGPLIRGTLLQLNPHEFRLLLNMHHIVSDGWSMNILIQEIAALYESFVRKRPSSLPPLPIQYADFAHWQRSTLHENILNQQLSYWQEHLKDAPPLLEIPTDRIRPPSQTFVGERDHRILPKQLATALKRISLQEETTLFIFLLSAFKILLYRYTDQTDLVIGSPIAGRNQRQTEPLIGFFINSLALRTDLSGNPTFRELLKRVRTTALNAYAHQDIPFERVLEALPIERSLSYTPLFQVFFNFPDVSQDNIELTDLIVEILPPPETGTKFDLTVYVTEQNEEIKLELVYNIDLFVPERIQEMLAQFHHLLQQIVHDPNQNIDSYSLVTERASQLLPDPKQRLGDKWQGSIVEQFTLQAQQHPMHTALVDSQSHWTYQDLESKSNQLAHYLSAHNIQSEDVVAIYSHRSAELVWAILGVLKAGAAFMLLDPNYPANRLLSYLTYVKPRGWLQLEAAGPLPESIKQFVDETCSCQILAPDAMMKAPRYLEEFPTTRPEIEIDPGHVACITFTSGSTGRPNGVLGRHSSLSYFTPWFKQRFGFHQSDRFSMLSGLAHDPLQRDIFIPMAVGGTLYIPEEEDMLPSRLSVWLSRNQITVTNLTPAMGKILTSDQSSDKLPTLRYAFFVGEALTRKDVSKLQKLAPNVTVVNYYGATETQRSLSYFVIPSKSAEDPAQDELTDKAHEKEGIPIGRGIDDVQLLILNKVGDLAGIGEVGEIYMRSLHLAKGYLDTSLSAERFISNPFTQLPKDRLYKTGDTGYYLPDGNAIFWGRSDLQINVRGFRVEPREIESVLHRHPAVMNAVVAARDDNQGNRVLVAYIKGTMKEKLMEELRPFLQTYLPLYMIPSLFIPLQEIPLTANGKVNQNALPAPDIDALMQKSTYTAPRTAVEETIAQIWAEVMGLERVGITDNFFELGGHSLLAVLISERIRTHFRIELPLRTLFEEPTVANIATFIEQNQTAAISDDMPIVKHIARGNQSLELLLAKLDELTGE